MWRVAGGQPHWEGHNTNKKMWSPLPVPRREPVRLPFLEVTPNTVIERYRGQSPKDTDEEDRGPLALWSTEPIELSRTAPPEFGAYRGVYLGKLRQGSALSKSLNTEKGFTLLPTKYSSGGIGSARANERGGLGTPPGASPAPRRRIHALEPLDQDNASSVKSPAHLAIIPPLRSAAKSELVTRRVVASDMGYNFDRSETDDLTDKSDDDDTLNEEDELAELEDEGLQERDLIEEDYLEEEEEENRSSSTVPDSGLSLNSGIQDDITEENVQAAITRKQGKTTQESSAPTANSEPVGELSESETAVGPQEQSSPDGDSEHETDPSEQPQPQELEALSTAGRNSYDQPSGGLTIKGGRVRRRSTNSLPASLNFRQPALKVKGKGFASHPSSRDGSRAVHREGLNPRKTNIKNSNQNLKFNSFEYESDFESEGEDAKGGTTPNQAMTRMKMLKKKRDSIRELERKLTEREVQLAKEQRIQKYKELELRHSGNSLQITGQDNNRGQNGITKGSPRPSLKLGRSNLTKSQSHDQNLHQSAAPADPPRPRSLDREEGVKPPFSKAPTQGQRKTGRSYGGLSPTTKLTLPSHYKDYISSRKPIPSRATEDDGSGEIKSTRSYAFSMPTPRNFSNNYVNHGSLTPTIFSKSLAPQFRTASESNLNTVGKTTSNIRQSPNYINLDDAYLTGKDKSKNTQVASVGGNMIKNANVPQVQSLNIKTNPTTKTLQVQQNSLSKPDSEKYSKTDSSTLTPSHGKDNNSYFEINLEGRQNNSSVKLKKPPVLPSSRFASPINTPKSSSVPSSVSSNASILSEADIPSAAYHNSAKNYSTVQGRNFRAYPSPKDAYSTALELLRSNEWEDQLDGVQSMGRLATFHPEILYADLKEINGLLMKHAKNLRSQVARASIQVIMMFYDFLRKAMEQDLDKMVSLLLHKTSDTNKFLRDDSNSTLDMIMDVITPGKALATVINEGIRHRNPVVRTTVARLLAYSAERLTAAKALSQKDVAEKMLPALAKLVQEGSLDTRRYAKIAFQRLSTSPQFPSVLKKYVSSDDLRNIQKVLDSINCEGKGSSDLGSRTSHGGASRFRR